MPAADQRGNTKNQRPIGWTDVKRVLVVKLRSIGDTVLATPSLIALKRFLPDAQVDIVLEDWVAPVLDGFEQVDNVLTIGKSNLDRLRSARELRRRKYDVAFNLHGGTTATMLVRASGARHRIGLASYQYPFLYNHLLTSPATFWGRDAMHSAEQQLALLGFVGVPVDDRPKSRLVVTDKGRTARVGEWHDRGNYAVLHPGTAFYTKQWSPENYARTAEFLSEKGLNIVVVGSEKETSILDQVQQAATVPVKCLSGLTLPEITALASNARLFVGNDSGIAHIAAAMNTPTVVIFGSSNRDHWRPWDPTNEVRNEIVYEEFACQPCAGYECKEFGEPRCILSLPAQKVFDAISRMLAKAN